MILLKEPITEKALLTLYVTTETRFLLRKNLKNTMHGISKKLILLMDLTLHPDIQTIFKKIIMFILTIE